MPSPFCVPKGVLCTALTLTCTTLGPTSEATSATGSSAGTREDAREVVWDDACGEASAALSSLFPCKAGCLCEQPASITAASTVASAAVRVLDLRPNVLEPPVGALGASFATESIRRSRSPGVNGYFRAGLKGAHEPTLQKPCLGLCFRGVLRRWIAKVFFDFFLFVSEVEKEVLGEA